MSRTFLSLDQKWKIAYSPKIQSVEAVPLAGYRVYRSNTLRVLWPDIAMACFSGTPAFMRLRICRTPQVMNDVETTVTAKQRLR
jgi:hypothetical protein